MLYFLCRFESLKRCVPAVVRCPGFQWGPVWASEGCHCALHCARGCALVVRHCAHLGARGGIYKLGVSWAYLFLHREAFPYSFIQGMDFLIVLDMQAIALLIFTGAGFLIHLHWQAISWLFYTNEAISSLTFTCSFAHGHCAQRCARIVCTMRALRCWAMRLHNAKPLCALHGTMV